MRFGLVEFDRAEIWGFACEVIVNGGQQEPGVDGLGVRPQAEIEIHGMVHLIAALGVGWCQIFEDVEINFNAMRLLTDGLLELGECTEGTKVGPRCNPRVLRRNITVGSEAIVVTAVVICSIRPSHDPAIGDIFAEKQVIPKMNV